MKIESFLLDLKRDIKALLILSEENAKKLHNSANPDLAHASHRILRSLKDIRERSEMLGKYIDAKRLVSQIEQDYPEWKEENDC